MTRTEKKLKNTVRQQSRLMMRAADALNAANQNNALLDSRNDFWRNLITSCAFASGLGNERKLSEVIAEVTPALMGVAPSRADNEAMAAL